MGYTAIPTASQPYQTHWKQRGLYQTPTWMCLGGKTQGTKKRSQNRLLFPEGKKNRKKGYRQWIICLLGLAFVLLPAKEYAKNWRPVIHILLQRYYSKELATRRCLMRGNRLFLYAPLTIGNSFYTYHLICFQSAQVQNNEKIQELPRELKGPSLPATQKATNLYWECCC